MKNWLLPLLLCSFLVNAQNFANDPLRVHPEHQEAQIKWVDSVYQSLSLKEKVAQLFMPMVFTERDSTHFYETLALIEKHKIGGLIFSLGDPVGQSGWLNAFQSKSKTPLLIAMDAEWGVAMRLDSVSPFPWPMTLGAIQDSSLIRKLGKRMGEQEKRLGIHYSFGPVLDINTNADNPIIGNRSFGSSKARVSKQALAYMQGHHEAGILTSGKHFPGHGDTAQDSHKTLPTIQFSADRIRNTELAPYRELIAAGLSSVMVAHLSVPSLAEKGLPSSLSKDIIQGILKNELGFTGLIVTDALNMKGVSEYQKVENIDLTAFLAGHDMLLISNDIPKGIAAIASAYQKGKVTEERLAHSVKKVLKAKFKAGLAAYAPVKIDSLLSDLNTVEDQQLIFESMSKAITLLKNEKGLLPLTTKTKSTHIVLGDDDASFFEAQLKKYASIRTVKEVTPATVLEQTKESDTVIVSFHRSNATPWKAYQLNDKEIEIIKKLASSKTLILDLFVKPYVLKALEGIQGIDALIVSYQNSKIAQELSVDALFGAQSLSGRLPVNVSPSFQEGDGLDYAGGFRLGFSAPEFLGFDPTKLQAVDDLAQTAIDSMMTPGMQIVVARKGKIVYDKNFGFHTYEKKRAVQSDDHYDLASLTKIMATLPLVMQSVAENELSLDTTVAELLPKWKTSNKASLTLRDMLSHYARLWPWIPFYKETLDKNGFPKKTLYQEEFSPKFSMPVAENLFLRSGFETELYQQIQTSELIDSLEYKYSDLPYYLLKKYYENKTGIPYDQWVDKKVFHPLGLNDIGYVPLHRVEKAKIVPSEIDTYFRHRTLQGYVHDMGAAMQNGVGGHAGVFGTSKAVAAMMQMYLQKGRYNGIQLIPSHVFDQFNFCTYCNEGNRRGVGFDKPQIEGLHQSTCGCVSPSSFGHSGYTGTYAWADPEKEIIVVILANRTFPNNDFTFSRNNVRTRLQEKVYNALMN